MLLFIVDIQLRKNDIETTAFDDMQSEMESSIIWLEEWIPIVVNDVYLRDLLIWFEII